ncbi:unnamed protein product [Anisakis simplex]|uniref:GATA zinc finger domain-containing protein 14-like n=1 Tax=Anisakis simplex TaxID=6269 RepID=A0A0M3KAA3_ANISI|nr:unnamed protein product [Anisakis simplex]
MFGNFQSSTRSDCADSVRSVSDSQASPLQPNSPIRNTTSTTNSDFVNCLSSNGTFWNSPPSLDEMIPDYSAHSMKLSPSPAACCILPNSHPQSTTTPNPYQSPNVSFTQQQQQQSSCNDTYNNDDHEYNLIQELLKLNIEGPSFLASEPSPIASSQTTLNPQPKITQKIEYNINNSSNMNINDSNNHNSNNINNAMQNSVSNAIQGNYQKTFSNIASNMNNDIMCITDPNSNKYDHSNSFNSICDNVWRAAFDSSGAAAAAVALLLLSLSPC